MAGVVVEVNCGAEPPIGFLSPQVHSVAGLVEGVGGAVVNPGVYLAVKIFSSCDLKTSLNTIFKIRLRHLVFTGQNNSSPISISIPGYLQSFLVISMNKKPSRKSKNKQEGARIGEKKLVRVRVCKNKREQARQSKNKQKQAIASDNKG